MWNPSTRDYNRNKVCKIDEYLDIKNVSCQKNVLAPQYQILNTTETFLIIK